LAVETLARVRRADQQADFESWQAELDQSGEPIVQHDRLRTELVSEFVEALPVQFVTQYELDYLDGQVVDADGRSLQGMCRQELGRAQATAAKDIRQSFYVGRAEADLKLVERVDGELMDQPAGTTLITFSPFPYQPYELQPQAVRARNYRPNEQRGLIWLHRKLDDDTLQLTSLAVDGMTFEQQREMFVKLAGPDVPPVSSSEQLPHLSAELVVGDEKFEQLLVGLKDWAEIDEQLDSVREIEHYGHDVVNRVYQQQRAIEQSRLSSDLPLHLAENVSDLLRDNPNQLRNSQIDPGLLTEALNPEIALSHAHRQTLKRAALLAGFSTVMRRLNKADDQSYRKNLDLTGEMGNSGRIFVNEDKQLFGCSGSLGQRFGSGLRGNSLESWGKDTGPGTCKDCKQYVEERGGCEICVNCHLKHQTLSALGLVA